MMGYKLLVTLIALCCISSSCLEQQLERKINEAPLTSLNKESEYLILFGDIQHYTEDNENIEYYKACLKWINRAHDEGYSIKAVLHTGDLTQSNTPQQWARFDYAIRTLNPSIPVISCIGNHDYDQNASNRSSAFNQHVDYLSNPYFQSSFSPDNFENAFFKFRINEKEFFLITLEFGIRDDKVEWANRLAQENASAIGIVLTHANLFKEGELFDKNSRGQNILPWVYEMNKEIHVNDGKELWKKMVSPNPNVRMVISGHKTIPHWNAFSLLANQTKNDVLNVLFNPEDHPKGGDGWIALLEFKQTVNEIHATLFSPILNSHSPLTTGNDQTDKFIFNY